MKRVYNFSAGPSMLPLPVLEQAADELVSHGDAGMSVMEMSHRTPEYEAIIQEAQRLLRELMGIPDNYKVLFLQGGATTQFAAVCYNLLNGSRKADYVVTGQFSGKAAEEAHKYGDIRVAATSQDRNHTYIPALTRADFRPDADYVHICYNNTIFGTRWTQPPDTGDIPLVADISSCILSEPIDVSRYAVLYAGAQKNLAPAGVTIVIVRDDLLGRARPDTPVMLDWKVQADNDSMYNTPPCWSIYMMLLVLRWLRDDVGGAQQMGALNRRKAALLYDYLDSQDYYLAPAEKPFRSLMNVTFKTGSDDLDKRFAKEAQAAGLVNLKGHRSVGGMRASIYNAMPQAGVAALVDFMRGFAASNPKA